MNAQATMARLRELLAGQRFRLRTEEDLQEGIARNLESAGIPFEREFILSPGDRVDFLVGDIALEVKVAGSLRRVVAQLVRYAAHERVRGVLLVTTRACAVVPPVEINGKPVSALLLLRGFQ